MPQRVSSGQLVAAVHPLRIINEYQLSTAAIDGFSTDTRTVRKGDCFIALKGPRFDGNDYVAEAMAKGASLVIVSRWAVPSPTVPVLVVADTLEAYSTIAHLVREQCRANVIGVTGSVGKTTTKEMLFSILREKRAVVKSEANENNIIGVNKTLCRIGGATDICIAEMGSNKYGEIAALTDVASPDIGIITEVGPAHLEGFYRMERVVEEKRSILKSSRTIGVVNFDNHLLRQNPYTNTLIRFGSDRSFDVYAQYLHSSGRDSFFLVNDKHYLRLKTPASFNISNALAAIGSSMLCGFSLKEATQILNDFEFPPQRMQTVEKDGYFFLNDTYNANPLSFISALKVVQTLPYETKIGVCADMLELGETSLRYHKEVVDALVQAGFKYLFFIGETMHAVGKTLLADPQWSGRVYFFGPAHEQVAEALRLIVRKGNLVFLKGSHAFALGKILDYF